MDYTKKTLLIFGLILFLVSGTAAADLDSYYLSQQAVDEITAGIKEAAEEVEQVELPKLKKEVQKQIADLKKGIEENQQWVDHYREKFKDDQENFIGYSKGYQKNIELNKRLINLLEAYQGQGLSQIEEQGKKIAAELENKYNIDNLVGGPTLEVLAGIYWSNFKLEKIDELISFANSNKREGITEQKYNSLNNDYEKRFKLEASDPGNYWGARPIIGGEKELYAALFRLGSEYQALSDNEQLKIKTPLDKLGDKYSEEFKTQRVVYNNAKIIGCRGSYIKRGSRWGRTAGKTVHARRGVKLYPGDQILVTKNGGAKVRFFTENPKDYREVNIWPESKLLVVEYNKVEVKKGFLHMLKESAVNKLNLKDSYEVVTPSAVLGIRGTEFITYVENDDSVFFLKEGEISVKSRITDSEIIMEPGQSLVVVEDGRVAPVEEMTAENKSLFDLGLEELLNPASVDPAFLENGLNYTIYETAEYFKQNDHPQSFEEMDNYFNELNSGVNYLESGVFKSEVNWTEIEKADFIPDDYFSFILDGYIYIPTAGNYLFALDSDDASDFWLDNKKLIEWYGIHGMANNYDYSQEIQLEAGYYPIQLRVEDGYGGEGLRLAWKKPGDADYSIVPAANFFIDSQESYNFENEASVSDSGADQFNQIEENGSTSPVIAAESYRVLQSLGAMSINSGEKKAGLLLPGDELISGEETFVEISRTNTKNIYTDNYVSLQLWPDSQFAVNESGTAFLESGLMRILDKKDANSTNSNYTVETPVVSIYNDSSDYIIYVDTDGTTVIFLNKGILKIRNKFNESDFSLSSGQTVMIMPDGYVSKAEEMTSEDREMFEIDITEL